MEDSIAHKTDMNEIGKTWWPDGMVPWEQREGPEGPYSCSYCGSADPAFVAKAIREGIKGSWADWKYGWPHKAYFTGLPHSPTGKFYSVHLMDATPEDRETIEAHLGIHFEFYPDGTLRYSSYKPTKE